MCGSFGVLITYAFNGDTRRFAWTMRILGFIQLGALIISNTTLARRLPIKPSTSSLIDLRAFREVPYTVYCGAGFLGFLGFTTVSFYFLLLIDWNGDPLTMQSFPFYPFVDVFVLPARVWNS